MNSTTIRPSIDAQTVTGWPANPEQVNNARNLSDTKEVTAAWALVGIDDQGKPTELAAARWYMARSGDGASPVYCSLWVHGGGHPSGHGRATGCGYCKRSAALSAAFDSAGIKLAADFDGQGEQPSRAAMLAIAEHLGYDPDRCIVVGYGF